jgi:hypothetical protein
VNEAERRAREIAADVEQRTGRKVKSVEVTVQRTTRTERTRTTREQIEKR